MNDYSNPLVSICIPSLNTRPFLEERKASILEQSLQDFEIVIVDDGSTDGSWDFFESWASTDSRVSLFLGPQQGLYPGWNDAIRRSRGKYIYIATSDDTMCPNLLQNMVEALENNPDCGIAHCQLKVFSENAPQEDQSWWSTASPFAYSLKGNINLSHKRMAPGDGFLHGCGTSVYVSTTQLLTRREVFDKVGYFTDRWGSIGDFDWAIRAGLDTNVIHVPSTWGGWRIHQGQATATANMSKSSQTVKNRMVFLKLIEEYLQKDTNKLAENCKLLEKINRSWKYVERRSEFKKAVGERYWAKSIAICFRHPHILLSALAGKIDIQSRWHSENEKIVIDCLLKNLSWIKT